MNEFAAQPRLIAETAAKTAPNKSLREPPTRLSSGKMVGLVAKKKRHPMHGTLPKAERLDQDGNYLCWAA